MPQAIVALAIYASAYIGGTIAAWTMAIQFVLSAAVSFGLSRVVSRKPNLGNLTNGSPLQLTVDPTTPMRVIYGTSAVGPCLRFRHVAGANNKYLYLILVWAGHECQGIPSFRADGNDVPLDGSGNATGTFAGVLRVTHHLGAYNQAADANFVSELAGLWTTDHRLQGRCFSAVRVTFDQAKFPTGLPQFTAVVQGRKVFDWRDGTQDINTYSTWKFSDNPSLCMADYIRGVPMLDGAGALYRPFGVGAGDDSLPSDKWIAAANACDEAVSLAAGGTEKRYTCNGCFDTNAAPPDVLDSLAGAMAGKLVPVGSEFHPYAGVWVAPDFTVNETMLRGLPSATNPLPRRERINVVKGTFIDPASNYQPNDFAPIVSNTFITADGGELAKDLVLSFTNSATMAQRIAKIVLLRSRQGLMTAWPCNLRAIPALTGENVQVNSTEFGWTGKNFEVVEFQLSIQKGDDGGQGFVPDLTLQETDSSIFAWSTSEEQALDPAPNTNLPDPRTVAAPTGLGLTVVSFRQPDSGSLTSKLQVAWTAAADQLVTQGGLNRIQYKKHADPDWIEAGTVKGDQVIFYILGLLIGTNYDVQVQTENRFGVPSTWVQSLNFAMTADMTAPAVVTDLSAAVGTGKMVVLSWTKNTEADFGGQYNIYRGLHSGARTKIGTRWSNRFEDVLVTLGTAYDYDVRPVDDSGNEAPTSNVVTATPSVVGSSSVDTTPPSDPSAPTLSSSGARVNGDGSIVSFFVVNMPSMPSGAVGLNLYARKHLDAEWTLYNQSDTGGGTCNIDGLEPGTSYDIGLQAFSFAGYCSNIITLNSQTAPNTTSAPAAPSGLTVDGKVFPKKFDASNYYFGLHISWTANTELDLDHYEVKVTSTNSDGATDYTFIPQDGSDVPTKVQETALDVYKVTLPAAYVRVRAVNRSGLASPWTNAGADQVTNANTGINFGTSSGTIAQGNDSRITGAAQKAANLSDVGSTSTALSNLGGAAKSANLSDLASVTTARQNIGVRDISIVYNATGGTPTEGFTVNHGIGTQQFKVLAEVVDPVLYNDVAHDYGSGSNDANNTRLVLAGRNGGNVQAGNQRITIHFLP